MFSLQDVKNSSQPSRRHPYITYRMEENDRSPGFCGKASCAFAKTVQADRLRCDAVRFILQRKIHALDPTFNRNTFMATATGLDMFGVGIAIGIGIETGRRPSQSIPIPIPVNPHASYPSHSGHPNDTTSGSCRTPPVR